MTDTAAYRDPQDDPAVRQAQEGRLREVWKTPTGWRYWSAVNNTEVGQWYLVTAFVFFLFAGVLALIMRTQLAAPGNDLVSPELYNQLVTLHGSAMMFLFAVPIFEAVAILLLPGLLGARDLPFPRLSAFGFWCFLIGGVFVSGSIFFGSAPQGGWFMYPPLTTRFAEGIGPDVWLLGLSFIEIASIAAAVELIVGVLKCRPPGMTLNIMPLYGWYVLVVGVMILFAFPPLIAGDLMFELERMFDWPFFDPARGGDPVLWQHLFWIFGHPEVYIVFLPSMALVAMIVPTFARTPMVGYTWVVLAAVGTGFLSFGLWVHHMFTIGLPNLSLGFFSAASEAVAIPTGIQIFAFIATLFAGRMVRSVPMLFCAGGLAIFVFGGLTGVMVALAPFDWQAHDTYFVVAHLHYVLIGGMLFPIFGGIYYYYPLIREKMLSPRLGTIGFWLMFVGFNVAFLPMHFTGLIGMPRRVATYPELLGLGTLNLVSTVGAFGLAAGVVLVMFDVVRPKRNAPKIERNPWNAGTLEWMGRVGEVPWGSRSVPAVESRYPLWDDPDFVRKVDEGRFYLPDAQDGQRETIITSVLDAVPEQCMRLAGPSFLPMLAAVLTGGVFISETFHWHAGAIVSAVLALGAILAWVWTGTSPIPEKETRDIGLGTRVPIYGSGPAAVGWWGMFITMTGIGTAFASLIFGYFFYWTVHEQWPPDGYADPSPLWTAMAALAVVAAWLATRLGRDTLAGGNRTLAVLIWFGGIIAVVAALGAGAAIALSANLDPTRHVYDAIVWVVLGWGAAQAVAGTIMLAYCIARVAAGRMDPRHHSEAESVLLYWHFTAITMLIAIAVVALFPYAVTGG